MSKKYLNGLLIVCVLVLWGVLGYKYFVVPTTPDVENNISYSSDVTIPVFYKKDTVALESYDRDPFLGRLRKIRSQTKRTKLLSNSKRKIVKQTLKKFVNWPSIQYLGFIKNKENKTPLILLKVEGKLHRVKVNQLLKEDLFVKKYYKDSLALSYQGQEKIIKK